jgi:pimeloyl-ACP methyl ester carboxylesterase
MISASSEPLTTDDRRLTTLIALAGNGGGAFRFDLVAPHLLEEVRLRAITLPGFAGVPRDLALRTVRDYAVALHGMVGGEARPVVLLGHGIGGAIVLEYLQLYADEVAGLILHAPVGTRLDTRLFPRLMGLPGARALGKALIAARPLRPLFRRRLFSRPLPPEVTERFFEEYRRCAVFGQMFAIITPEWFAGLRPVPTPAALLWGANERVLGADQAGDYRALLPNSTIRIVRGWDHYPMYEQPVEYAREIATLAQGLVSKRHEGL